MLPIPIAHSQGRFASANVSVFDRLEAEVYDLAYSLKALKSEDRRVVMEALEILRSAIGTLSSRERVDGQEPSDAATVPTPGALDVHALKPLAAALAVYDAVVTTLANEKSQELNRFGRELSGDRPPEDRVNIPPLQKDAG